MIKSTETLLSGDSLPLALSSTVKESLPSFPTAGKASLRHDTLKEDTRFPLARYLSFPSQMF